MKRLIIFLSFILLTSFFIAANTQKQRPKAREEKERLSLSDKTPHHRSRETPYINQPTPTQWARFINENGNATVFHVLQANDGGFFIAGTNWPSEDTHNWLLKLFPDGKVEWKLRWPDIRVIQSASDGGYFTAGYCRFVGTEFVAAKFSSQMDVEWYRYYEKTFSGDRADFVWPTNDGGCVVAGSSGGDIGVLKLSSIGDLEWQKRYGGPGADYWPKDMPTIIQTSDGGYILGTQTSGFGAGWSDLWILKLDSGGDSEWQKTYGGINSEWFPQGGPHIHPTSDGGYILAGNTLSFGAGYTDAWIIKLSSTGAIDWQKRYGGEYSDWVNSIQPTSDGKYILAGATNSFGLGLENPDGWLLKISPDNGAIEWEKAYGGDRAEFIRCVQQTSDGGYIVAGHTHSFNSDDGYPDIFVMKVDEYGNLGPRDGLIKVRNTNAVVVDTNAVPSDTSDVPVIDNISAGYYSPSTSYMYPNSELVASSGHQPPLITDFSSSMDRGFLKGIRKDKINGEMHPWNIQNDFDDDIEDIKAFWKRRNESYTSYRPLLDEDIPVGDAFEVTYTISDPSEFDRERVYAFATKDSLGRLSPLSPGISGAIDTTQTLVSRTHSSSSKEITRKDTAASVQLKKIPQDILVKSKQTSQTQKQSQTHTKIQPPRNVAVIRGENSQTISWEQNPLNDSRSVIGYNVYRVWGEGDDVNYELIGWVSSTESEFVDYAWDPDKRFRYAVSTVDLDYKESSKKPVKKTC
jgi:hypothetical protein